MVDGKIGALPSYANIPVRAARLVAPPGAVPRLVDKLASGNFTTFQVGNTMLSSTAILQSGSNVERALE